MRSQEMSWAAAVRKQARTEQFVNCVKRISLLFLIKLDNRMWGIPLGGGQTISQRGRERTFKFVYLCRMCVWSHTDPWAEWLWSHPSSSPGLAKPPQSSLHACLDAIILKRSQTNVFWNKKNNITTELDYIIRYLAVETRLSIILGI